MADATSKKSIILLVFTLCFSLTAFSQKKKLKQFSNEFAVYLTDLDGFMTSTQNDELKSVYKQFLKSSKTFSESEKVSLVQISNKMLSKRLRPNPHFSNFLLAVISVDKSNRGELLLPQWLKVFEKTVDESTTNKLMLFCSFTSNLVSQKILRSSNR